MEGNGQERGGPAGPGPSRADKRRYFALMSVCIGLFVISWAVANAASATDRRRR